jgi:hypothetical protein
MPSLKNCFLMLLFYLAIFFIWILVLAALEFEINSDSVLLSSSYVDPDLFIAFRNLIPNIHIWALNIWKILIWPIGEKNWEIFEDSRCVRQTPM